MKEPLPDPQPKTLSPPATSTRQGQFDTIGMDDGEQAALNRKHLQDSATIDSDGSIMRVDIGDGARMVIRDRLLEGRSRIPGYNILRLLGRGGMGTVYEAEQLVPKRRVALKVVNAGTANPRSLKRMDLEAQVLGLLHHPGIAQIYEAGTFEGPDGPQPFFAMELIEGESLGVYLEKHKPSVVERLTLLAALCDAIQHAHQKGIIHRDLKPENILVEETGKPKVLDFGVARLVDAELDATTMHTRMGVVLGTVPYMSPEQVSGDVNQVDTRTDVYSLGIIGYEMLAGRHPLDISGMSLVDAASAIRELRPVPLSNYGKIFKGDLATIIGKALEKDRDQRYQSAAELAADIRRYLNDEPIVARPPGTLYQLRKFARRHKALVFAALGIFAALLIGLAAALWQADVARRERDIARVAQKEARLKAEESRQTAQFVMGIFQMADPRISKKRTFSAKDIIDSGAAKLDAAGSLARGNRWEVVNMLALAYSGIGEHDTAGRMLRQLLADIRADKNHDPKTEITVMQNLLVPLCITEHGPETVATAREALKLARESFGEGSEMYLAGMEGLAWALHRSTLFKADPKYSAEAVDLIEACAERTRDRYGEGSLEYAQIMNTAGRIRNLALDPKLDTKSEEYIKKAISICEGNPDQAANLSSMYSNLAGYYSNHHDRPKAREAYDRALQYARQTPHDTQVLTALKDLGDFLLLDGRTISEAETCFLQYLEEYPKFYGDDNVEVGWVHQALAGIYIRLGRKEAALEYEMNAYPIIKKFRDPCEDDLRATGEMLISVLLANGNPEEAGARADEILNFRVSACGERSRAHAECLSLQARVAYAKGNKEESKRLRDEEREIRSALRTGDGG